MSFGLQMQDLHEIIAVLKTFTAVEEAVIFGSRAKGNYKKGSDVDIAVKGKDLTHAVVATLSYRLNEESFLPYFFDVLQYEDLTEEVLVSHIDRVGKCIYTRD